MTYRLFGFLLLFFSPVAAMAGDIMFEGYYRIELDGKHVGYTIQRYEFEPKDKTFTSISFVRAKFGDKIVQESTKAKANDKFQPLSYQYTSLVGTEMKTIDGTFSKGDIMDLKIIDGKKVVTQKHKIPKGTFFSSFLTYLMLQKPLELNQAFQYSGIAEEDGASYNGKALIESKEAKPEYVVFRILNSFKGEKFASKVAVVADPKDPKKNIKAEVISTNSPDKSLSTELVAQASQATEGQMIPNKVLVDLFGTMPTGKANLLNNKGK